MRRGDDGVTLIELLVCIAITGVVMSALAASFFASTRSINDSSARMANTHDSQMAASFFSSDMQSSNWLWTATPLLGFSTCGSGGSIATFAWVGSDSAGSELTKVATYRVINQSGEQQLVRSFCSGHGLAITPTSTVVIAHNLYGPTPTVDCFGPASTPLPSCDGRGVAVAQLTARAQANDADGTGFDYVLRATRRVSPSPSPSPTPSPSTPGFVQTAANRVTSGMTNPVPFKQTNTTGNLIVAYVVWNNAGAVNVTDTSGNTYTPVSASVSWNPGRSAQVFYAKNVAGGTNTVTANFATAVSTFGLLYITEYSGIDKTDPLDVTSSAPGTGAAMNSGTTTTTNANDLLVGLGASDHNVIAADAGYTRRSDPVVGDFGNIVEDRTVTATGGYNATATQDGSGWVMQLVAFRADAGGALAP